MNIQIKRFHKERIMRYLSLIISLTALLIVIISPIIEEEQNRKNRVIERGLEIEVRNKDQQNLYVSISLTIFDHGALVDFIQQEGSIIYFDLDQNVHNHDLWNCSSYFIYIQLSGYHSIYYHVQINRSYLIYMQLL